MKRFLLASLFATLGAIHVGAQVPITAYVNFEGAQTNPVRISADGTRLYAVNTPDNRLSVFDLTNPSAPNLIAEIPVGIEPVSVNPLTKDEVWVANQESNSISVVSVSRGIVTDTLHVKAEPMDVAFAGSHAFITASRLNLIYVFDVTRHTLVKVIPLIGGNPRAMAVSSDGSKVYAAFALSGNRTTLIPTGIAPAQQLPPGSTLPAPPRVGLIVDATNPTWSSVIRYTMPDNDVVAIDTSTLAVAQYYSGLGTINLGLALRPGTGDLYVANTDARNLVHFEPNLRGHWINNRITRVLIPSGQVTAFDLNPKINYSVLPNPAALSTALSQPAGIVFDPGGSFLYVAAFGTDRVARLDTNGNVQAIIEIGPATGSTVDPAHKRGPRGLALHAATQRLYVMNRISNTISIIDTSSNHVIGEIPAGSFDPTPTVIRQGRGFLYDAKLSGNGTGSCAACHIDGEMDHLAWDLGNPFGQMATVIEGSITLQMHPMKGPMTTQTLRGLQNLSPYHWRGDRADFTAFNPAFSSLMGGTPLSASDMAAYTNFINTVQFAPNPNQNLDRTLPASFNGADPNAGQTTFMNLIVTGNFTCNACHTSNPGPGTNRIIDFRAGSPQPIKVPHLRNLFQKIWFDNIAGASTIDGFGFGHDGEFPSVQSLLNQPNRFPGLTAQGTAAVNNVAAYNLCFDTGTAPAVGFAMTLRKESINIAKVTSDWAVLQNQAAAKNIDLIAKGTINGQLHGLLYRPVTNDYMADKTGLGPFTQAQITTMVTAGDIVTLMGVPPGSGVRMGIDRNLDGILDGNQ